VALKKRVGTKPESTSTTLPSEGCKLSAKYSTLWDFLVATCWPDGELRVTGTVMLLRDGPALKAWIHDRAQCCSTWVSGPTLTAVLERAEKALDSEEGDWREDRPQQGAKRSR